MREGKLCFIKKEGLQLLAVTFMLSDHIWATYMSFGDWMTYIGRMAFPIFAFLISEGFRHTSDIKKYILRLTVFAVASEIPFNLFYSSRWFNPYHQNAIFTLLLGLLAIAVTERLRKGEGAKNTVTSVLLLIVIALASVVGFTDYGFLGVLTVVMFYICSLLPFTPIMQLIGMIFINAVFFEGQVISFTLFEKSFEIPIQAFAVFSLVFIWLYNGKKGKSGKAVQYVFYAFYPVHMLILYLIKHFA